MVAAQYLRAILLHLLEWLTFLNHSDVTSTSTLQWVDTKETVFMKPRNAKCQCKFFDIFMNKINIEPN